MASLPMSRRLHLGRSDPTEGAMSGPTSFPRHTLPSHRRSYMHTAASPQSSVPSEPAAFGSSQESHTRKVHMLIGRTNARHSACVRFSLTSERRQWRCHSMREFCCSPSVHGSELAPTSVPPKTSPSCLRSRFSKDKTTWRVPFASTAERCAAPEKHVSPRNPCGRPAPRTAHVSSWNRLRSPSYTNQTAMILQALSPDDEIQDRSVPPISACGARKCATKVVFSPER